MLALRSGRTDGSDLGRHAILVAPEIDHAYCFLVAAAAVPDNDFALVLRPPERFFGSTILLRRVLGDVALSSTVINRRDAVLD